MNKNPDVDKYIAASPDELRPFLTKLREKIFEYFPEGEEVYAYRIPVYKYMGKPLFSIASFKDHYSLVTQDKDIATKIPEVASYKVSGTTIHFTTQKPISDELLKKIIKLRKADRENSFR